MTLPRSTPLTPPSWHTDKLLGTYRNLMILYADADRKNVALHVFKECCSILKKELDTEPEVQTQEIYIRIR